MNKEASSRIKINKLLEESGWRFFDDKNGSANIELEPGVKYEDLGDDFEHKTGGFIDFLLLDKDSRPLVVVEAKKESINPLSAKEQARGYARNKGARFIILSNGNIHYFWDTENGNPEIISRFPTQESITQYKKYQPNPSDLINVNVDENFIVEAQMPNFINDPDYKDEKNRKDFLKKNNLKQLRSYQVRAVKALQNSVRDGRQRFLFEMATGTGKTLISAAVIRLFLKSGNARRILFLVDRIELEDQAWKAFDRVFKNSFRTVIYKKNRDSWKEADIVVSTVQTFLSGDKYKKEFSPTDFELVISDEAHRSIGGNSRVVFEYFVGYKLGLTATPKDYLKGFQDTEQNNTQREYEKRIMLDTYKTFGCDSGEPTFRYDLLSGVKDGFLINPIIVDARTEITTELLSKEGYSVHMETEDGSIDEKFTAKQYEKKFFNEETNIAMCKVFIDNALYDPVIKKLGINLLGKSIVFCVSQNHAAKITNILNKLAFERWPDIYNQSDFAVQITSNVADAQQMTINFSNNKLNGQIKKPEGYDSCKTRIAVTVGMMTTGYDCQDILNIALMRPVFSPSEFVQIKGRGTRKYTFEFIDYKNNDTIKENKERFKFFDFFATCEYFEKEFKYEESIKLPRIKKIEDFGDNFELNNQNFEDENGNKIFKTPIDILTKDDIVSVEEIEVTSDGMKIDREGFKRAIEEDVLGNKILKNLWDNGDVQEAEDYTKKHIFDKPKNFINLDKIKKLFNVDRRITVNEFLQFAFGEKNEFETKDELLEKEWQNFIEVYGMDQGHYSSVKNFFKAYIVDDEVRDIIKINQPGKFFNCSAFDFEDYQNLNGYKDLVPKYIHDYAYHLTNL